MYIVTEAITRLSLHQWMVNELCECIKNYDIKWRRHCKATQYHVHPWDPWNHKRRQLQATNLSMLSSLISMSTAVFNGVTSFLYSDHGTQLHIALRVLLWNVINMIKVPSFVNHPRLLIVLICVEELWCRHHDMETISALLAICGLTSNQRNGDNWYFLCCYLKQTRKKTRKNSRITGNLTRLKS